MTRHQILDDDLVLARALALAAESGGDLEACVDTSGRLTFGEWWDASERVAQCLARLGVGRGDVVCLLLPSSRSYLVAYLAAARIGAITSGISLRMGRVRQEALIEMLHPAVTIVGEQVDTSLLGPEAGVVVGRASLDSVMDGDADDLAQGTHAWPGQVGFARRVGSSRMPSLRSLSPSDPLCVVWTSGSTGMPKGAVFDNANLVAVARGSDALLAPGDRRLCPTPFSHVGTMTRVMAEIVALATSVVTPEPWSAESAIRLMADERVTVGQGVPTQWRLVLDHPVLDDADLGSMRIAATGGAPVPPELVSEVRERLGCPLVVRYTSTEASLGTGTLPDDPPRIAAETVGRPVAQVELRIASEEGRPVAEGEVGLVQLRSPAVMRGYLSPKALDRARASRERSGADTRFDALDVVDRESTSEVLDAVGWLTTGDLGLVDELGNLRLAGRLAERYLRGGYNVYPAEVEGVIRQLPGVADVAVVGMPDPVVGEIGVAVVVAGPGGPPTLQDLRARCEEELSDYKAPDRMVVLDALPRNAMGKVAREELKALVAPRLEAGFSS